MPPLSSRPIIFSLNCPQSFEASLVMASMSDGTANNNNQTRDLDESAAGASSSRNRRSSEAEAARDRLSRSGDSFVEKRNRYWCQESS